MREAEPVATVRAFVGRINAHDVDGLAALGGDQHVLIDAVGKELSGREALRDAWRAFFEAFPDYHIEARHVTQGDGAVGVFGTARGTCADPAARGGGWAIPVAWLAIVRDGRVVRWQVYCDTAEMRRSLEPAS